jgi:hypothetical protein
MADVLTEQDPDPRDNEELVVVDTPVAGDDDDMDDAPIARAEDDDSGTDDEREAIRERRRQEKLDRKQRRDEAIKRDKLEMDFLRKRNDDLERRLSAQEQRSQQTDLRGLDAEIARAQQEAEMAERVIAKAVAAGNGDDVAQALKYRDAAQQRAQQLHYQKQQYAQSIQQSQQPVGIDAVTMGHAQQFLAEHSWYDPQGRNEDSAIVLAIDQTLVRDGYSPQSADYWTELRKRAARRLPDRFKAAPSDRESRETREPRGGPAVGSGREHAPATTRREVYISPERKQALIDAGVWDDPVLRAKYVKRYAEYDRQNRA